MMDAALPSNAWISPADDAPLDRYLYHYTRAETAALILRA